MAKNQVCRICQEFCDLEDQCWNCAKWTCSPCRETAKKCCKKPDHA